MLRVTLLAVGRMKAGPERDLAARFIDRASLAGRPLGLTVEVRELEESRARSADMRERDEAKALLASLSAGCRIIACDERGAQITSSAFADLLATARDAGHSALALVIGGPDGLDASVRSRADHVLAFGAMTWPHQLVRIMAAEQLYRAATILAGHPYHRS